MQLSTRAEQPLRLCGQPSCWRWAERCRHPSCSKCYRRFVESEITKAVACFGSFPPHQIGWLTIDLGRSHEPPALCAKTTNRLRNTIDRQRHRRSRWDDVEVRTLFRSDGDRLTLTGFAQFAYVAPIEFARVLATAWSIEAVRVEPLTGQSPQECIREVGSRWHTGPETTLPSFRSMRLTVGARWVKRTRHSGPVINKPEWLEPMPVSVGYDDQPW